MDRRPFFTPNDAEMGDTRDPRTTQGTFFPQQLPTTPPRTRPTYPDVKSYDGEDPEEYQVFRTNLEVKFTMDDHYFRDDKEKVYYAFGRLDGKASRRLHPWLLAKRERGEALLLEDFYKAMDLAFSDPDRKQRALVRINTMRQGKRELRDFLSEFEQTLAEAGGLVWSDAQKKALLETAVNIEILRGAIGFSAESYEDYRDGLLRIEHQIRRIDRLSKRTHRPITTNNPTIGTPHPANTDRMDWEPTNAPRIAALEAQIAALRTNQSGWNPRAQWVPETEIQKRRATGACLRCGNKGHLIATCPQKPASRPTQVAATNVNSDNEEDPGNE
jgi:hypothetical protein